MTETDTTTGRDDSGRRPVAIPGRLPAMSGPSRDWMWFEVGGRRVVRRWSDKAWTAAQCLDAAGFDSDTTMLGFYFPAHGMLWFENPRWRVWPMGYRMVVTPVPPGCWEDRRGMVSPSCRPVWWPRAPGCRYCGRSLDHLDPGVGEYCAGALCHLHDKDATLRGLYAIPYHRAAG